MLRSLLCVMAVDDMVVVSAVVMVVVENMGIDLRLWRRRAACTAGAVHVRQAGMRRAGRRLAVLRGRLHVRMPMAFPLEVVLALSADPITLCLPIALHLLLLFALIAISFALTHCPIPFLVLVHHLHVPISTLAATSSMKTTRVDATADPPVLRT